MQLTQSVSTVVHVIQLAVAPVFLLTGSGAILILGLLSFLREIYLATGNIHVLPRSSRR